MMLVVGLGNPGKQYEKTRHNVGFMTIDIIRETLGCKFLRKDSVFEYFDYRVAIGDKENKIKFVRPLTYMNLSGGIFPFLRNENIEKLIVITDNIDLEFAKLRFKFSGGSAGHNGLKSIISSYEKSNDFYRLYIGCGRKEGVDTKNLVLSRFSSEEERNIILSCKKASDIILEFLKDEDVEKAKKSCSEFMV